ncbi:MAG: hypothetical protein KFF73_09910 [Cyclobacteriaceae bacterium]|nr:hypothetical protein [Cyclobacteriaceae bacterium]
MNSKEYLPGVIEKLSALNETSITDKIFVGFDGYIDKIQKAVKSRSVTEVTFYTTLTEFSKRIAAAAGRSGQVELVTQEVKIGGNAPIMANALGHLGISSVCLGNGGYPDMNNEYKYLHPNVSMVSIGDPAETNALEFNDGKMILSELSTFRKIDWKYVENTIGRKILQYNIDQCDILALVGWCNPDHATDVWKGIMENLMPESSYKKLMLFDLADPTKKSKEDLREVLKVIEGYTLFGPVILGINENETLKLYDILNEDREANYNDMESIGQYIFSKLSIDGLLIHPVDRCILVQKNGLINLEGNVVMEPKISTGGGDNLNAGFCAGYLLGLTTEESLILGMATSGAYVQNGKSPSVKEIIDYLGTW